MEIRVKVDGEDKIVRGVTNQITVENVIVAVAETTGRKGRYTLVRKSPNCERILTPTDKIVEILKKKKTKDTFFELKKTTDLEINEQTVLPERSSKRKSLPPKLKHRPNAVSSNRDSRFHNSVSNGGENTRMRPASALGSLISGDDTIRSSYTQSFDNSLQSSSLNRNTLPTRFQNNDQTRSMPRGDRRGNVLNKIAALNGLNSSTKSRYNTEKSSRHQPSATSTLKPRPISMGSEPKTTLKPLTRTNQAALDEFKRLVSAQHHHIHEQAVTLHAVDKELQKAEVEWKNGNIKKCNQADVQNIKLQIKQLEATVSNNEAALRSEQALLDRLNEDEQEAYTREMDISKVQEDIRAIEKSLQTYKENAVRLEQDIERERKKQKERQQRAVRLVVVC